MCQIVESQGTKDAEEDVEEVWGMFTCQITRILESGEWGT